MSFVRSREMCLAQLTDESAAHSGSERWVRADPFGSGMKRLSVGRIGSGKTVGAMAAASRVLGAYPDARVLVFTPFPESYARVADVLDAKTGPETEAPSAVHVRPAEMPHWSESVSELPAVSITDPHRKGEYERVAGALTRCHDKLADRDRSRDARTRDEKRVPPVYLIVDEADRLFRSSVALDFRQFFRPLPMGETRLAIHALAPEANASQLRPITEHFSAIDLYPVSKPRTVQWLFGLSAEHMAFICEADPPSRVEAGDVKTGTDGAEALREAAPTGLCYTAEDGWHRVRYPLFTIEAETMLDFDAHREPAVVAGCSGGGD